MIVEVTGLDVLDTRNEIRVSGNLENHYAPKARVIVGEVRIEGAGFIALANIATPSGMNRVASPGTVEEYARDLYKALREADHQGLKEIVVVPPQDDGLALAIRDRIEKARTKDS